MYDLSVPNDKPGACAKCRGTGKYCWGAVVNGRPQHEGTCFSCRGTGKQRQKDIARNRAYNRHKISEIAAVNDYAGDGLDARIEDSYADICGR